MIEVLISIVIASLALLGLAGLQISSLRYQKIAHFRTLATQHGVDMADRVRANIVGAKGGFYDAADSTYAAGAGTAPACAATKCTPAEVAALDIQLEGQFGAWNDWWLGRDIRQHSRRVHRYRIFPGAQ